MTSLTASTFAPPSCQSWRLPMTVPCIVVPDLSVGAVIQVPFCLISTWYFVTRSPSSMASRMLSKLAVTGEAGVTSRRAEVLPLAAAQYVQRSSSTALAASNPSLAHVESAVAGCPFVRFVCVERRVPRPELLQQGDILRVELPGL